MFLHRLRLNAICLGLICACTLNAAGADDSYREATALGWHVAARVLSARGTADGLGSARVRVSVRGPSGPAREVVANVQVDNAQLPSLADQALDNGGMRQALIMYKSPLGTAPLVRVTVSQDTGRNTGYFNAFVQMIDGRLQQVATIDLRLQRPDHARRISSPGQFSNIWRVESWNETKDRVGGSDIWHHAIYSVTTPGAQRAMLSFEIETGSSGVDTGTPDPKATPYADEPLEGRSFCLWHELQTLPGQPAYYAPC